MAWLSNLFQWAPQIMPHVVASEWEHGYETPLVRATRYNNPHFGYNIGFVLPKHPHDCDRADMMDWLITNGVGVMQCGGYPGAEIHAVVKGVTDKQSANEWLPNFLPEFHEWIRTNLR